MREYHIYMQRTKCVGGHFKWIVYKWLPWEHVECVEGTKELYTYFKSKFKYCLSNVAFYYSLNDDEYLRIVNNWANDEYLKIDKNWDFMIRTHEYHRYLIMDDHGNVRDFHQLTKKYKKKYYRTYHKHHGWNIHWASTVPDQRKSITPEEIIEVKNEYGITLKPIKPKRKIDFWDYEKESKVSGWKMQSKRKKQWKVRKET